MPWKPSWGTYRWSIPLSPRRSPPSPEHPLRYTDSKDEPLTGQKSYPVRLSSAPPHDAFWSLTMYDAKTKMLIENEIKSYKVGSNTPGLKTRADGSFEIPISHTKPTGEFADNWLPAPEAEFYVILRTYQPQDR